MQEATKIKNANFSVESNRNSIKLNKSPLLATNINLKNQLNEAVNIYHSKTDKKLNNNIFGIHGGGNIGLGLMADIISKSSKVYKIIATSNNDFRNKLINQQHVLRLQYGNDQNEVTEIKNITMISRQGADIVFLYRKASILALSVTEAALSDIAPDIAKGLYARFFEQQTKLKILVLMNKPNCANFVREQVCAALKKLTNNDILTQRIMRFVEFVATVVDRIVCAIPEEKVIHQLRQQLLLLSKDSVSERLGTDDIEKIIENKPLLYKAIESFDLKYNLFQVEKNFSMHVPSNFAEGKYFPLMKTTNDLPMIETIKNKYINGPHAILAWIGALMGYQKVSDAIKHPDLYSFINELIDEEIAPILCREYRNLSKYELQQLKQSFIRRCRECRDDTVLRVGRDPLRKLESGGRIRGTIELAKKHGMKISTKRLEQSIALGVLYAIKFDSKNIARQKLNEMILQKHKSFYSTVEKG